MPSATESTKPQLPRFFLVLFVVMVVAVATLTVEVIRLDRRVRQVRCDVRRATAVAVLGASGRPSSQDVLRELTAGCTSRHEVFDL